MHLLKIVALLSAGVAAGSYHPGVQDSDIERIIEEGKNNSQASQTLRQLTKDIGPRLTSSTNLEKATKWAVAKFEEYGLENVHLEEWGEWEVGFDRGPSHGRMVSPIQRDFEFTAPSWSAGTNGPTKGTIVLAPKTKAEFDASKASFKGKWVIYPNGVPRAPRARGGETPEVSPELKAQLEVEELMADSGMLGRVIASRNELVNTSGNFRDKTADNYPKDVSITIRKSDMDAIVAQMEAKKAVELEFNLNHKFRPGPIKHYNVIAEIKGTERPDEVVVMGAHLDSWDGPGSEGAADNGNGTTVTIEAARILAKFGKKPKRTIRFILFTGEEQGLFGSRRYVEMHGDQLEKISAVFVEDGGANYQGGTYALEPMLPLFDPVIRNMNKAFPDHPMRMRQVEQMPRGGGSDHVPFNAVGVPAFFWDEVGTVDYGHVWHTQNDKFENIPTHYLVQSATCSAVSLWAVGNAEILMPRGPKPAPVEEPLMAEFDEEFSCCR